MSEPLAHRLRPKSLKQFLGQKHLLAEDKPLAKAIVNGHMHSMILWGPPGCGKTTLAKLIASSWHAEVIQLSAVEAGIKQIRETIAKAELNRSNHQRTILFIDEIHRFNKAQQDALLPHVESGIFTFIGATTENPAFEVNQALLSRCRCYVLHSLTEDEILALIQNAFASENFSLPIDQNALKTLAQAAGGDARWAISQVELLISLNKEITPSSIQELAIKNAAGDKGGDQFYDLISALHKSVRGSQPDAALYWFARMLEAGIDVMYIARRLIRMASEDVGNADLNALKITSDAALAYERLGSPEGELAVAQAVSYLASCPKSNAVYKAYKRSIQLAKEHGHEAVPLPLRNATSKLTQSMGWSEGYRYAHDEPHAYAAGMKYLPQKLQQISIYQPTEYGTEKRIKERLTFLKSLDSQATSEIKK